MKETRVASRYAKSLIGLAIEKGQLDAVHADMSLVESICADNRDLSLLLQSPIIKADKKHAILNQIFSGKLGEITTNFLDIIVRKRREVLIPDIASAFLLQYKIHKGITTAELTSAVKLDDELKERILKLVASETVGKQIDLVEKIDPSIIGGFMVRIGDKQIDASIARNISDLKKQFSENHYISEL